ncbi:hypothetical protein NUU61_005684 [Penicillium alfredii]|uniref:Nuclear pore complex protein Nup85 n=1 Tax=Penicillium alfredii TaxID=1506179 RepID=A0A9W9K7W9_9EURO|nr:uncharacterized protein NUU61_005684 [Penicillium alfredii]KAJ5096328.1 hypothetical protein NUU61_005684 [Penicillium alfredii]
MTFQVPYDSSPPSTPDKDKSRSFWSNVSTTPAGPPPSTAKSFTPQGPPPSDPYTSSQMGSLSKPDFSTSKSLFTRSGNINTNDSIFGSSFGSTDYGPKRTQAPSAKPFAASESRFGATNGSTFGQSGNFGQSNGFATSQMSEYNDEYDEGDEEMEPEEEMEEEEEEEEVEDAEGDMDMSRGPSHRLSFLDSNFGNPLPPQSPALGQRKPIYTNPTDAKRPRLDERWANQSPVRKTKLSPKKASAMPSILHNLVSRSRIPAVDEPSDMIINTEDALGRLYDELRETEYKPVDIDAVLSYIANKLAATWDTCADRSGITRPYGAKSSIGPGEQAPNLVKASFLASLLLQIHHPSRSSAPIASASNPAARTTPNSMVKAMARASVATPLPQILLDWLNGNHASQTNDLQALRYVEPNPTASSNFWDIINAAVLRGRFAEVADVFRSADFNYARSALEDGLVQPGYRGMQLQNIQRCINKALQILDSCPGFQDDDWDITGPDWTQYRKRVLAAVNDLEEFAEGEGREVPEMPVQENRFQAVNFGLNNFGHKPMPFTQSARMAESRVPWSIYQNLRSLYRIILGDTASIKANSRDWVEATIGLTAWWDGEDDDGAPGLDFRASTSSNDFQRSRGSRNQLRAVDRNLRDAYLRRLDLAFSSAVNEPSANAGFQPNTMSSLEVGLAAVFEGNVQGVVELLQTWSLCVATGVAEVAWLGGWFDAGGSSKKLPGLSESDLMVLSFGQDNQASANRVSRDDILRRYAFGLYDRRSVENETGAREGWEMALEVLSRLDDADQMKKAVAEIVDKLPLENIGQLDKLVVLCSDLGLEDQGRRVSERFGDMTTSKSESFGLALLCYARAQNRRKVKSVVDLLVSYSLVQSRAYPATADLDPELRSMIKEPKSCLSSIASVDEEAARILQFYLSGYATLRRFYEIRDEALELQEGQRPRFKPLARRRAAAQALAAVIGSAADNIYGGLYDPERDSAVQVDGLLALLGEALVFVNQPTPILTIAQQFTILSAIEDLETVTPRVYAQCEECFRSTLLEQQASRGTSEGSLAPSPRALLKKSVSGVSASTFSVIGNDMLELARTRSGSGSDPASVGSSGVLVPRPSDKDGRERGWDWRVGLPETTKGADVLRMLRLGLARGLTFGALGSA